MPRRLVTLLHHRRARAQPGWPGLVALWGLAAGLALWASGFDLALQYWLWDNYHQGFNTAMRWLGEIGKGSAQAALCLLIGLGWAAWQTQGLAWPVSWPRAKRWWRAVGRGPKHVLAAIPVFALAGILNFLLKFAIGRPRPKEILMNGGNPYTLQPFSFDAIWYSFPSGHACSTFAIAVWLGLAFPRWRWPLLIVATLTSLSRFLALTPHYAGDVIAGAALGAAVAGWLWYHWYPKSKAVA